MKDMHDRIVSIPVIGRIARVISAFIHAPDRLESVIEQLKQLDNRLGEIEDNTMQRELLRQLNHELKLGLDKQNTRIQRLENIDRNYLMRFFDQICRDDEGLEKLNQKLSIHPTVWGSKKKLNISPDAAVSSCLFNTNSGTITIGDYTFAGSNVSILAGSHDVHLRDFLRREAEITEGCDIRIGRGVWLASGCTILGPCTIGDHSVIAAGAVVIPGTKVPPNCIYGGIPARQIGSLEEDTDGRRQEEAVLNALRRNGGVLFVEGWGHKKPSPFRLPGYWLQDSGTIFVSQPRWILYHYMPEGDRAELTISCRDWSIGISLSGNKGEQRITLPCDQQEYQEFEIRRNEGKGRIMLVLEREEP